MTGWVVVVIVAVGVLLYFSYQKRNHINSVRNIVTQQQTAPIRRTNNIRRLTPAPERAETGSMVYFANDRHGQADREYRFNYKKINGAWRAYILRMPSLNGRDANSITTHRLWDEDNNPYICWKGTITSLKDIQNISRVWADSIQEYIATGRRFGPE